MWSSEQYTIINPAQLTIEITASTLDSAKQKAKEEFAKALSTEDFEVVLISGRPAHTKVSQEIVSWSFDFAVEVSSL